MGSKAVCPVKEMPHFHPSGICDNYFWAKASVLPACHIIATCDFSWSHRFSHSKGVKVAETYGFILGGNIEQQENLHMQYARTRACTPAGSVS